jgi:hypothetical protein
MSGLCTSKAHAGISLFSEIAWLLKWHGIVIPALDLLGGRVCVVASLNQPEHDRRQKSGASTAITDPWVLQFDEGPIADRPARWQHPPVHIIGVLALRQTWRSALTVASGFAAFSARAVVLPPTQARSRRLRLEAAMCGVGVVACEADALSLVEQPMPGPVPQADRSLPHRLIEETVYERVLAHTISER